MNTFSSRREGFALAGAVLAMVLVGAIVTGGFYAANQETRATRSTELGDVAQYIAETGLDAAIASANAGDLRGYALNTAEVVASNVSVDYGGRTVGNYTATVTRISNELYTVRSTGTVTLGGSNATRTVANVVRIRSADFDNKTAFQIYGDLTVQGTADINGVDKFNPAWSGCSLKLGTSGVTANPGSTVQTKGAAQIVGGVDKSTPLTEDDFMVFGDMTWDDLKMGADKKYTGTSSSDNPAPAKTGTACNYSLRNNWGAPTDKTHPCFTYFPIIWAEGNLDLAGNGEGQGILMVEGDLRITGNFQFFGVILVKGSAFLAGTQNQMGTIRAYGGGQVGELSTSTGTSGQDYSSCAIERAVFGNSLLSRAHPIRNRSWFDITGIQNSY